MPVTLNDKTPRLTGREHRAENWRRTTGRISVAENPTAAETRCGRVAAAVAAVLYDTVRARVCKLCDTLA